MEYTEPQQREDRCRFYSQFLQVIKNPVAYFMSLLKQKTQPAPAQFDCGKSERIIQYHIGNELFSFDLNKPRKDFEIPEGFDLTKKPRQPMLTISPKLARDLERRLNETTAKPL